jgi:hypothetical protein
MTATSMQAREQADKKARTLTRWRARWHTACECACWQPRSHAQRPVFAQAGQQAARARPGAIASREAKPDSKPSQAKPSRIKPREQNAGEQAGRRHAARRASGHEGHRSHIADRRHAGIPARERSAQASMHEGT